MKRVIKRHLDALTVPEAIRVIHAEYLNLGYDVGEVFMNQFTITFDDGTVTVVWEDGCFYEIIE